MVSHFYVILVPLAVVGLVLHSTFISKIKERQFLTWDSLGRPSWSNNSMATGSAVIVFLFSRRYAKLKDPVLTKWGDVVLSYSVLYLLFFLATLIVSTF